MSTVEAPTQLNIEAASQPPPMYQDENITVYAVLALPSASERETTPTLKRKRSGEHYAADAAARKHRLSSPRSRSKSPSPAVNRQSMQKDSITSTSTSATPVQPAEAVPLLLRFQEPTFVPHHLKAIEASEWRKLTIDHMFGQTTQSRYCPAWSSTDPDPPPSRPKKIPSPANCDKRLPVWNSGLRTDQRGKYSTRR